MNPHDKVQCTDLEWVCTRTKKIEKAFRDLGKSDYGLSVKQYIRSRLNFLSDDIVLCLCRRMSSQKNKIGLIR